MVHKNPEDESINNTKCCVLYIYSLTQQMRQDTMCVLMTLSGLANDTSPPPLWLCPVCRVHIRVNITTRTATGYKLGGLMFSVLWLLKWQLSPLVRVWCHVLTGLIDWERLAVVRTADDWALVRLSPVHKDIIKEKRAPMMMMIGHMVPAVTGCGDNGR